MLIYLVGIFGFFNLSGHPITLKHTLMNSVYLHYSGRYEV